MKTGSQTWTAYAVVRCPACGKRIPDPTPREWYTEHANLWHILWHKLKRKFQKGTQS